MAGKRREKKSTGVVQGKNMSSISERTEETQRWAAKTAAYII